MNFMEILNLPYPFYLLLRKDSWIDSFMGNESGREMLKNMWRLRQTAADESAVREMEGGAER